MILEVALLIFLILIKKSINQTHEELVYYFVVQALGRRMILLCWLLPGAFLYTNYLIILSLLVKIGVFPFQSWYLNIIHLLDYNNFWILRVPLKLIVIKVIYLNMYIEEVLWVAIFNIALGFSWVLKEKRVVRFLALGSIFNTGWALLCINSNWLWLLYMLLYGINLKILLVCLYKIRVSNLFFDRRAVTYSHQHQVILLGLILIGIPPFAGFILKLGIFFWVKNLRLLIATIALCFSLAISYYYLLLFFYTLTRHKGLVLILNKPWIAEMNALLVFNFRVSCGLLIWLSYYLNNRVTWWPTKF